MNHVHIAKILFIILVIVHHGDNFSFFSYRNMNTNFSSRGFESNSNFYTSDWSNHSDFSWQAHVMGNYAPQSYGLHHLEYPQFDNPSSNPLSYNYPSKQSSLEDSLKELQAQTSQTLKEFMQLIGQSTSLVSQELSLEDALNAFRQTIN
jgi:exonuclease VII small subunit